VESTPLISGKHAQHLTLRPETIPSGSGPSTTANPLPGGIFLLLENSQLMSKSAASSPNSPTQNDDQKNKRRTQPLLG
jgi:hypothetical protein